MTRPHRSPIPAALLGAALLAAGLSPAVAPPAAAQAVREAPLEDLPTVRIGDIEIEAPWSRATPPGGKVGAGYMLVRNHGAKPVSIVGASAPFAQRVELHSMAVDNGYMQMKKVDAIEIPAGGEVELKPGGYHLMFVGLTRMLRVGKAYDLTVNFSDGTEAAVKAAVWDVGLMRSSKKE